jgi:hypothetical protein
MPSPSTSLATLRPDLAASFEEFDLEMNQRGFISQRLLPVIETAVQSGNFGKIPIEQLLQNPEVTRAPGGGYSRGKWTFLPATFACQEYGWEEPIDEREAKMYANYFDVEQISSMRAYGFVLLAQEIRAAALLYNTTVYTGAALTTAIVNEWDDFVNAVPIDDVEAAVRKVYTGTGLWPNALVVNKKQFRNLRQCEQIIERIASFGSGSPVKAADITADQLARVFDLEEILIGSSSKNTALEGQAATPGQIWSDEYASVCRICKSQDIREPGLGRIIHWGEDGSQIGGTVETYRDETIRGDVARVRHDVQEKILYPECAHLLSNVTT